MTVDHVWARGCQFKDCVRIDHLEIVPGPVNTLRGGNPCAVNSRKTNCIRGHEFTPENTMSNGAGGRACRACHNERGRQERRQNRPTHCPKGHLRTPMRNGKLYCAACHADARRKVAA